MIGLALLIVAGAVVGLSFLLHGSSKTAAVITTIVASVGLSSKGLGSTLGSILRRVEQPVCRSELARAAAFSATRLSPDARP